MKENREFIQEARRKIQHILEDKDPKSGPDPLYLKDKIHKGLGQLIWAKTQRQPMILPVIIEV